MDELNKIKNESNSLPSNEQNIGVLYNDVLSNSDYERNVVSTAEAKPIAKKTHPSLLSSFVFLCAMAVVLPLGITIPVFSDIISPIFTKSESVYVTNFFTNVDVTVTSTDISIKLKLDPQFTDFVRVMIQLENLTDPTWCGDGVTETTANNNSDLETGTFVFNVVQDSAPQYFCLRIYCATEHPENIEYSSSCIHESELYYLIYTKDDIVL